MIKNINDNSLELGCIEEAYPKHSGEARQLSRPKHLKTAYPPAGWRGSCRNESVILDVGCSILVAISAEESILDTRTSIEYQESSIEMIVGVMTAQLHMQGVTSLKEKRSIIKSVVGRLKSRFNISVAEVEYQDNKTLAVIGVAMVSNETRFINQQFDTIINFMQKDGRFYLGQIERETFS